MIRTVLAALAGAIFLVAAPTPALAADGGLALLPSPYGGSLSAEEQKASAATRPALADANWNHEVCVIAYSYENTTKDIATARSTFEAQARDARMHAGGAPAEIERVIEAQRAALEARIGTVEKEAAKHLANIPKCKGQFFRPALESICPNNSGGNRFCAQLTGAALPGVELIDDKLKFAHGLAWNKVGELFSRGATFAPAPWAPAPDRPLPQSTYAMTKSADGAYYFKSADDPGLRVNPRIGDPARLLDHMAKAKEAGLEAASRTGISYIATVNNAMIGDSGEDMPYGTGQWSFSIGVDRFAKYQVGHEVSVLAGNVASEAGMVTDLGEYWQLPHIHFQALLYDILVQSDFARFAVEKADGETVALNGTDPDIEGIARFQTAPTDGPFFGSSYPSYRVHAVMTPTPDDLKAILASDAVFLVASFEMLLEDGSIDVVTLRTPLTGLRAAWEQMNRSHGATRDRIRQTVVDWDRRIAGAKGEVAAEGQRRRSERQAAASATAKEAREYIAAKPFARDCGRLPDVGSVGAADSLNRQAGRVMECDKRWVARARAAKDKLGSLRWRYASLGGTESFIADEIKRWDDALDQRHADFTRYNAAIEAHNRGVMQRASSASASRPAIARRQRSHQRRQRNRGRDGGHDYASEFFEAQTRPQRSMFRDVTIPPRPNGYLGTGYW